MVGAGAGVHAAGAALGQPSSAARRAATQRADLACATDRAAGTTIGSVGLQISTAAGTGLKPCLTLAGAGQALLAGATDRAARPAVRRVLHQVHALVTTRLVAVRASARAIDAALSRSAGIGASPAI